MNWSFLENRSPKMELTASETSVDEGDEVAFTLARWTPTGTPLASTGILVMATTLIASRR